MNTEMTTMYYSEPLIIRLFQLIFLAGTIFFSHNKSVNSIFQPAYQPNRTGWYIVGDLLVTEFVLSENGAKIFNHQLAASACNGIEQSCRQGIVVLVRVDACRDDIKWHSFLSVPSHVMYHPLYST
jgi:hypothetical protein